MTTKHWGISNIALTLSQTRFVCLFDPGILFDDFVHRAVARAESIRLQRRKIKD